MVLQKDSAYTLILASRNKTLIYTRMGECHTSNNPNELLTCSGLGSCIGLIAYDYMHRIGGSIHVVSPKSPEGYRSENRDNNAGHYADITIPHLLNALRTMGADRMSLQIYVAGGAQMFKSNAGLHLLDLTTQSTDTINTGLRNIIAVKSALKEHRLILLKSDTGGHEHRTLKLDIETGHVSLQVGSTTKSPW